MSRNQLTGIALICLIVAGIVSSIFWYSHTENVNGIVSAKWVTSDTHCSTDSKGHTSCTTTHTYFFQIQNGNVYDLFWGTRDYDKIQNGSRVSFVAHGYEVYLFGFRMNQPTVFDFTSIEPSSSQ